MTEKNEEVQPEIGYTKDGDTHSFYLHNVFRSDGSDTYFLFDPENPPYETSITGSGSLSLTEKQARFFHNWMSRWIKELDSQYVEAFLQAHPNFGEVSAWALARSADAAGVAFCSPCRDWHVFGENCEAGREKKE